MISASPQELKIQKQNEQKQNNWSNFSAAYLEISHRISLNLTSDSVKDRFYLKWEKNAQWHSL